MSASVTTANKPSVLSLDFGNYELKAFDGRELTRIRSIQKLLAQGQTVLKATESSPVIEIDGQRWHVGSQCSKYPSFEATVQGDKTKLAQLHLAACVSKSGRYRLVASHHSPENYSDFLKGALIGTHSYVRNGVQIQVTVESVAVIPEGQGTYQLAKIRGYIPKRGHTILIDLGGSTWLSSLYAADGELLNHSPHEREGTYRLAVAIASDMRLSKPLMEQTTVTSPDPIVIQDGFCKGHFYGDSDLSWNDWLGEYLDPWWRNIIQTLKANYQSYLPSVRRFIVTGGGSHLVSHKVMANNAFLVMPEANTASVQGAFYAATQSVEA